jgi:hypothetical protein
MSVLSKKMQVEKIRVNQLVLFLSSALPHNQINLLPTGKSRKTAALLIGANPFSRIDMDMKMF